MTTLAGATCTPAASTWGVPFWVRAQPPPFQRHSVGALPPLPPKTHRSRPATGSRWATAWPGDRYWNSGGGGAEPSFGSAMIVAVDLQHQVARAPSRLGSRKYSPRAAS